MGSGRTMPDQAQQGREAGDAEPPSSKPDRLTPLHELQLLERHRSGDPEALGILLRAYQHRIFAVCYRMLQDADWAQDLTQEALVKLIEGLDSYDGRCQLSTWVIRVSMNCCMSHLRRQRLRRHRSLDEPAGPEGTPVAWNLPAETEPAPSASVEQAEMRSIVLRALNGLDPSARALLVLRDMQSLDYEQIAEVLDVPIGTVKSRLFRARAALRSAAARDVDGLEDQDAP